MKISVKLISGGPRVDLNNASGISHLHRCSNPLIQARARARVAGSGPDSRGDAVEQLGSRCAEGSERLQVHGAKVDAFL